jgi:hypothetical protein
LVSRRSPVTSLKRPNDMTSLIPATVPIMALPFAAAPTCGAS